MPGFGALPCAPRLVRTSGGPTIHTSKIAATALCTAVLWGCGDAPAHVHVDGSSTVAPISAAVAEEFARTHPDIQPLVGTSGTGGGFEKFSLGETDINDASRPIKAREIEALAAKGYQFIEMPIAYDGIAIVAHAGNAFLETLSVDQLRRIWQAGSDVRKWGDLDPSWPDEEIQLYGPGTDSGTFDYFVETIIGEGGGGVRSDFTASENDNFLVSGVAGDPYSLGFFGYAYYAENAGRLKLIAVDSGKGPVAPSPETIDNGTYAPLSRPLFIYARLEALDDPAVASFVDFYLEHVPTLAADVGYVPLPEAAYAYARKRFEQRITGSLYEGGEQHGSLMQLIQSSPR